MEGCGGCERGKRKRKETESVHGSEKEGWKMTTVEGEMASRNEDTKMTPPLLLSDMDPETLPAAKVSKTLLMEYVQRFKEEQSRTEKEFPYGMRTKLVFQPSDEQLIIDYLEPKVSDLASLCVPLIPEYDVFSTEPWNLPIICSGDEFGYSYVSRNAMYFFQRRYMNPMLVADEFNCCKRPAGDGYWECYHESVSIEKYDNNAVGWKDYYAFKMKDRPPTEETGWVMETYTVRWEIKGKPTWMICKIYDRIKGRKRVQGGSIDSQPNERFLTKEPTACIVDKCGEAQVNMGNIFDQGMNMGFSDGSSGSSDDESSSSEGGEESSEDR